MAPELSVLSGPGRSRPRASRACRQIYLDYNASAPFDPRVAAVMVPALMERTGNASSTHSFGQRQAAAVDDARQAVAALVGTAPSGVVFTSSATEANNLALRGAVDAAPSNRPRILVSAVEHASVLRTARWLAERGLVQLDVVPVTRGGYVDLAALESLLGPDVLLVSVVAANGETGVLNPLRQIAELVRSFGALFHSDATQMVGWMSMEMAMLPIDLVSLSGHKICGPGGVGALVGNRQALRRLSPIVHGGGHERGLRSGSLNVAGIVGLGAAADIAVKERTGESERVTQLRDRLVTSLESRLHEVTQIGDVHRRLPNTANVRFAGADADAVVVNLEPVAASTGSACSSGSIEPSEVLLAMGLSREAAYECVRFSLGRFTTEEDIDLAVDRAVAAVARVRAMTSGDS
ncbi:MAG: cysteine desulfurase family protein [Gammaproteobacteria bacterium]|nr:cysteine desulfurase family protein [Gammaproteobacteria bacterium]MDE2716452.1 cysteine desulfurase family protein [Chloroflexota bacterium]